LQKAATIHKSLDTEDTEGTEVTEENDSTNKLLRQVLLEYQQSPEIIEAGLKR
jgi:hypothetical protein